MLVKSLASFMALGLAAARPKSSVMKRSPEPELVNGKYILDRDTTFDTTKSFTFDTDSLPDGLSSSDYVAGGHSFVPGNVDISGGYLELVVPGGQTAKPYACGEVVTDFNVLYASVRTVAILTEPAGVCNGMFFYKSDTQESDIEWLSDPSSESNAGTPQLWFTNQDANGDGQSTYTSTLPPADATSTEHEYRIDWTAGRTQWFVDGTQVFETTTDVPSEAGPWIWNNWADGDKGWTAGPPAEQAVFKIKSIDMYYNAAS